MIPFCLISPPYWLCSSGWQVVEWMYRAGFELKNLEIIVVFVFVTWSAGKMLALSSWLSSLNNLLCHRPWTYHTSFGSPLSRPRPRPRPRPTYPKHTLCSLVPGGVVVDGGVLPGERAGPSPISCKEQNIWKKQEHYSHCCTFGGQLITSGI